jgi:hypothetical protein
VFALAGVETVVQNELGARNYLVAPIGVDARNGLAPQNGFLVQDVLVDQEGFVPAGFLGANMLAVAQTREIHLQMGSFGVDQRADIDHMSPDYLDFEHAAHYMAPEVAGMGWIVLDSSFVAVGLDLVVPGGSLRSHLDLDKTFLKDSKTALTLKAVEIMVNRSGK